ncbi:unnamed protein product [Mycena citricolor]|uniref:HMG box domain-containing protein n=1 Tax=Mycena citricolor TaxID=2018698 RepID=A0AAD2Q2J8_9AGAR|nr:unnamed protein product [Mycena citricolor]
MSSGDTDYMARAEASFEPPSFAIISPTPRSSVTFSFPASQNVGESPCDTPSSSPFEPDLRQLTLANPGSASHSPSSSTSSLPSECPTPPPLSAFTHTLSVSSLNLSDNSGPGPIRRSKSSASESRRPKRGDDDYVKRPENAWILFRRKVSQDQAAASATPQAESTAAMALPGGRRPRQADLSKTISEQWRCLPAEEKAKWEALAKEKKREHEALYPDYVYRPQRASKKNRPRESSPGPGRGRDVANASLAARRKRAAPPTLGPPPEFLMPVFSAIPSISSSSSSSLHQPQPQARSSSVPSYQPFHAPDVFSSVSTTAIEPIDTSPVSLLDLINQASALNGANSLYPDDTSGGWDYTPSHAVNAQFAQSINSTDFLHSMTPSTSYSPTSAFFSNIGAFAPLEPTPMSLSLPNACDPSLLITHNNDANVWPITSPWAGQHTFSAPTQAPALSEGDFELSCVPGIGAGWDTTAPTGHYPGSEYITDADDLVKDVVDPTSFDMHNQLPPLTIDFAGAMAATP